MLGVIYLLLCFGLGFTVCSLLFPGLKRTAHLSFKGRDVGLSACFVLVPMWFLTGTLIMGWSSYILACIFSKTRMPLLIADETVMIIAVLVTFGGLFLLYRDKKRRFKGEGARIKVPEMICFALAAILSAYLMRCTFSVAHEHIYVGLTVFSDFTPHMSMIRSFSYGSNFPTQYSVCAGADVKYHFMFQFFVGNLEFLGMRIDHALNLPSFLGLMSCFSLLYALAVKISGRKAAGILTCLLFAFRSSGSLFSFLAGVPAGKGIFRALKENTEFIGSTDHESWGLWNLNVYCNQRHFAFVLAVMLLILILFMPLLYEGLEQGSFIKENFLSGKGWLPGEYRTAVYCGLMLGASGFWNGAVVIGALLVLFFMAAVSVRRLEYLIMAAVAGVLVLIQTSVFIDGSALGAKYRYGFLADNATFFGVLDYIKNLLGILPLILLIAFLLSKKTRRYLMLAFSTPMIMAFTVSLTPDIAVNHKYVMISVMLLDIFAATFIVVLFDNRDVLIRAVCVLIVVCMISTGLYDLSVLSKRDKKQNSFVYDMEDPLTEWIKDNTDSTDLFLTANYFFTSGGSNNSVILSGAMMYQAWQYFGWSAGYNTERRDRVVAEMYDCSSGERLKELAEENRIDYIIVDYYNRISEDYEVNEELIASVFPVAYTQGSGEWKTTIYSTGGY